MTHATGLEYIAHVPTGNVRLEGDLAVPPDPIGVVLFAHGSGSSRHSPRNRYVAGQLQGRHLATLLMDLLTPGEEAVDERTARLRFDIQMLTDRLAETASWLTAHGATRGMPIGYFGASTGAAAALAAAAQFPDPIGAVVSRGGRPDLAGTLLSEVQAPTLLIVGGEDTAVLELNGEAFGMLRCPKDLQIVPGATHLFEEPGALEQVARLAGEWFARWLPATVPEMEG
jgi:putative phosphoribosyl transferase